MLLSKKDIKEFYADLKVSEFYRDEISDIEHFYDTFFNITQKTMDYDEAVKSAISQAICFEYYDDQHLINVCEPARIYIVMAIARFLINNNCPRSFLKEEMKNDLETILKKKRLKRCKRFFSKTDYTDLTEDEKVIAKWFYE